MGAATINPAAKSLPAGGSSANGAAEAVSRHSAAAAIGAKEGANGAAVGSADAIRAFD
jgi:hypothetical protein